MSEAGNSAEEETVYMATKRSGDTFHLSLDCRYLNRAENVNERPRWWAERGREVCDLCAGDRQ